MKFLHFFCILILTAFPSSGQSEISLFNSAGEPVAYIDTQDEWTIYLWSGKPVAYITRDNQSVHVYGFNGKHLGWYLNGIIRDHNGDVVGFSKGAITSVFEKFEGFKGFKEFKPFKSMGELAPYQPYLTSRFSGTDLVPFLYQGISNNDYNRRSHQVFDAEESIAGTDLELMQKVLMYKQKLWDTRSANIQEVINTTYGVLAELAPVDPTNYDEQNRVYQNNLYKISTTRIDYSDLNLYNSVMAPLLQHLNVIKRLLADAKQKRVNNVYIKPAPKDIAKNYAGEPIYDSPSMMNGKVIYWIPQGAKVEFIEKINMVFSKVKVNNVVGYLGTIAK